MRKFKPNRKRVLSILAMGLSIILVGLALRPTFLRPQARNAPRTVMLSDLFQAVIDDARDKALQRYIETH